MNLNLKKKSDFKDCHNDAKNKTNDQRTHFNSSDKFLNNFNNINNRYIILICLHFDLELVAALVPKSKERIVVLGISILNLTHFVIFPAKILQLFSNG